MTVPRVTPEQLDQIQARADAATGGNWEVRQPTGGDAWVGTDYWPRVVGVVANKMDRSDAEFIAHARTDVPALLALVREQQARIERVEAVHEPKSWTKHGIPCFDEFDSPTARINGCTCGNEHYPCPTIAALEPTP